MDADSIREGRRAKALGLRKPASPERLCQRSSASSKKYVTVIANCITKFYLNFGPHRPLSAFYPFLPALYPSTVVIISVWLTMQTAHENRARTG
jgi:hypothetical protein